MTRFILHIGPHKTGTTYIQETLFAVRDQPEARGVHIPTVWNASPAQPSHMQIVWALRGGGIERIEEDLRTIMGSRYEHVVVSCEALSRLDLARIELVSYSHLTDQNVDIAGHFLEHILGIPDIEPRAGPPQWVVARRGN